MLVACVDLEYTVAWADPEKKHGLCNVKEGEISETSDRNVRAGERYPSGNSYSPVYVAIPWDHHLGICRLDKIASNNSLALENRTG